MVYRHHQRVRPVPNESLCDATSMDVHSMHSNPAMTPVEVVLDHLHIHAYVCVYTLRSDGHISSSRRPMRVRPGATEASLSLDLGSGVRCPEHSRRRERQARFEPIVQHVLEGGCWTRFEGHILGSRHQKRVRPVPNESCGLGASIKVGGTLIALPMLSVCGLKCSKSVRGGGGGQSSNVIRDPL